MLIIFQCLLTHWQPCCGYMYILLSNTPYIKKFYYIQRHQWYDCKICHVLTVLYLSLYRVLFWKTVQVPFINWNAKKMRIDNDVSHYADLMELSIAWWTKSAQMGRLKCSVERNLRMENVTTFHSLTRVVMKGLWPAYSCALVTYVPWTDDADKKCGISV